MKNETQRSITQWAQKQFGASVSEVALRMNLEVAELLSIAALHREPVSPEEHRLIAEELADVEIMLRQVAEMCGVNLQNAVNWKMRINRQRAWTRLPGGRHQHVENEHEEH